MNKTDLKRANRRLVAKLAIAGIAMFGFGYALVPLYDVFCELTGFGGRTVRAENSVEQVVDEQRLVTVEFVANLNIDAPWEFKPDDVKMQVHPGKFYQTSYYARNLTDENITGQAVYNLAPAQAGRFFKKIECFCFTQQEFGAKEDKEMPILFQIDPELPPEISTVTLSYTFYRFAPES
ncbi:MAG: cytochrome c oxidase assembly protein [Candidatus Competibacteraceae bacterium]|nr:cytochrome c oxidase assembly protein [Candidatus Competibacteraceae bacterium]MCB1804419.1 cytochrome c oxidase assembly protein [Candidatus Competibacteraceae bacterium]MCB1812586.1 cytochrome c oxidase assembly protein [Candidatus Competibacteraceae bacterium]